MPDEGGDHLWMSVPLDMVNTSPVSIQAVPTSNLASR